MKQNCSLIVDDDFSSADKPYIKTISPLLKINIKLVTQFPLDPMHLIFLGVVKRILLNYYVDGKAPYKLSQNLINIMNKKILEIKPYQPSDFARKCRSLKEIKRWKATEYKFFLLYYGLIILHEVLQKQQFKHFLFLHCAISILSNEQLISKYIDTAEKLLKQFVFTSSGVLGNDFVVYNVHSLVHLVNDVRKYGCITNFSCFPFENYLGCLKRKIRSKNHVLQQLHHRILEKDRSAQQSIVIGTQKNKTCEHFECKKNTVKSMMVVDILFLIAAGRFVLISIF